jgi:hypothetical protein
MILPREYRLAIATTNIAVSTIPLMASAIATIRVSAGWIRMEIAVPTVVKHTLRYRPSNHSGIRGSQGQGETFATARHRMSHNTGSPAL